VSALYWYIPNIIGIFSAIAKNGTCLSGRSNNIGYTPISTQTVAGGLGIKIYPNPAGSTAFLSVQSALTDCSLVICDALGQKITMVQGASISPTTPLTIDLTTLPAGVYSYQLRAAQGIGTGKLVVQK
jgi:hypothetical protein